VVCRKARSLRMREQRVRIGRTQGIRFRRRSRPGMDSLVIRFRGAK
jgi:hypothetical protein